MTRCGVTGVRTGIAVLSVGFSDHASLLVFLRCSLMIRDSSPSSKVELLRDRILVLPKDILAVVLMIRVSPSHGYGVVLKSVVLEVGGYRMFGTVISGRWFARREVWRYRWHG